MSEPLTFVTFRWQPWPGYRSKFEPETVYALQEMIRRHYSGPMRFVCVTDKPEQLPCVETVKLWDDYAGLKSPLGGSYPSCYRRLKLFAPDAGETFGPRLVCIDLDMVIVKDITPLFAGGEDFKIWGESDYPHTQAYNGSLWMLKTGARPQVWTEFGPQSPALAAKGGSKGSDQGWINHILGPKEAKWGRKDGVYSYRKDIAKFGRGLPSDARVVAFHGKTDPWDYRGQQIPWIKEHYPVGLSA
jgi:hypothetical protein